MLRVLAAYLAGDYKACSVVRVPTPDEEDAKRPLHRERQHLTRERLRIENRIEALLFTQGIRERPSLRSWERDVAGLRTGDGRAIPRRLEAKLDRLRRQLVRVLALIRQLTRNVTWPAERSPRSRSTARSLRCVASGASATISLRCLHARSSTGHSLIAVSRPVYVGTTPMPYQSGNLTAIGASAAPATHVPAQQRSSLPGSGFAISRVAIPQICSYIASEPRPDAPGASQSWPWRGSC
jgi:transposase